MSARRVRERPTWRVAFVSFALTCASLLATLFVATVLGCGEGAPAPQTTHTGALPDDDSPLDALARRHGRLRERLSLRGYAVMPRQARVFVLEAHGVAIPVDLDPSRCHTFAALGASGLRGLHAVLYDGEGIEVAADAIPREGALVHTCPQAVRGAATMPHHLVLFATAGSGSVAVTEAESLPGTGEGFEGIFEQLLAPSVPYGDVEQALTRSRTALRARGLSALAEPEIQTLSERGAARAAVPVEAGRCYVIVARGGQGIEDLDVYLFDGSGVEVGRDLSRGAEASIEHCANETASYTAMVRAYRGSGAVGLASFAGARGAQPTATTESREVDEALGVGAHRDAPDVELALAVAELVEQGFDEPLVIVRSAVINPREVRSHDVVIGPGCGLVVAMGSDEAMDIDLYLADPNGREVDVDTDTRSHATVRACASSATVMRVAVKVYGRDGTYALAVLRAPRGVEDVPSLRLAELTAEPRARGYVMVREDSLELAQDERVGGEIELAPGRCAVVAIAGRGALRDVDLVLRNTESRVIAADSGPAPHAISGWCSPADASGPTQIAWETHAYSGSGSVRVQVMEGPP